jgi:hypothetical protein
VNGKDNKVFLRKRCAEHGQFEALLYSDAEMYFDSLRFNKPGTIPLETESAELLALFDPNFPYAEAVAAAESIHVHVKVTDVDALSHDEIRAQGGIARRRHRPRARGPDAERAEAPGSDLDPDRSRRIERGPHLGDARRHDRPPDPAPALLARDQAGVGEDLGVVADRGLAASERLQQLARAHFAGGRDEAQQPESHRVRERGEDTRELGGLAVTQGRLEQRGTASVGGDAGTRHEQPPEVVLTSIDTFAMIDVSTVANLSQEDR